MDKQFYVDTETTGLDSTKCDIVSIGAIVEIDGVVVDKIDINMQPVQWDNITQTALDIQHVTIEDLKSRQPHEEGFKQFLAFVRKYSDGPKFLFAGHNIAFDIKFIKAMYDRYSEDIEKDFNMQTNHFTDSLAYARMLKNSLMLPDCKLHTVHKALFKEDYVHKTHSALSDCEATFRCIKVLDVLMDKYLKGENVKVK
jgi:DNA polymerase III alpha subunit (gram-positive type)